MMQEFCIAQTLPLTAEAYAYLIICTISFVQAVDGRSWSPTDCIQVNSLISQEGLL